MSAFQNTTSEAMTTRAVSPDCQRNHSRMPRLLREIVGAGDSRGRVDIRGAGVRRAGSRGLVRWGSRSMTARLSRSRVVLQATNSVGSSGKSAAGSSATARRRRRTAG